MEEIIEKQEENKKMSPKVIFAIRFIVFLCFALVGPATYLIVRFDLFTTTSKLQIGLWGCVLFGIIIAVVSVLIKFYLDGMKNKYSFLKQIVQGLIGLICPLLLVLLILIYLRDNINLIIEALYVFLPCESVAIIVNPLPKWCFENNVEGINEIVDKVLEKRKGEK